MGEQVGIIRRRSKCDHHSSPVNVRTVIQILLGATLGFLVWWSTSFEKTTTIRGLSYDFIVVGGGTAGCVLASRLSADPNRTVLLIEAGDKFTWLSSIPLVAPLLQGSAQDWAYKTQSQSHSSYGLWNQSSAWPRGRGLGGSNQLNYLQHFSGSDGDFSQWEESGAIGWGIEDLKPRLARMISREAFPDANHPDHNGSEHFFKICVHKNMNLVLGKAFVAAGREMDLNFTHAESTIYRGKRWSSLNSFLEPVLHRQNLHVLLDTHVDKIVWNENHRRATGVKIRTGNGKPQLVSCTQEVILSAGSINSPQILLRSGVGPKAHLQKLGVPIIADLPVGLNLHDHMNLPLYVSIKSPVSVTLKKILHPRQLWDYFIAGKGLLASSGIVGVGRAPENLGLMLFGMGSADEQLLRGIANYKPETFRALFPFSDNWSQEGFIFLASCLQPVSRGRISILNTDHSSRPIIDPQYMAHPADVKCMVKATQLAIQIASTLTFKSLGATLHLPRFKECDYLSADMLDVSFLECIVRVAAITGHHPGGTCKMGSRDDDTTVVDSSLRVHGIDGLRVMDASILPTPVSGFPNSVLIAMADRASDILLKL